MAVLERLAFLQQLPVLLKGTSDDDTPCPGYLYEEVAKISRESPGSSQCLLEYLLNRLQNNSCHVKLKVLKLLLYLSSHGPALFLHDLRRNVALIQEAAGVSGPPDPLHGISLYQKVRSTAQELVSSLFTELPPPSANGVTAKEKSQTGMGSHAARSHTLQGFGYSQEKSGSGTAGEALLSGIQRAAVAVTQAVLVGSQSPRTGEPADNNAYKPVTVPLGNGYTPTGKPGPGTRSSLGCHRSGVAGGGWDDSDSGHSSQDSLQEKSSRSLSSDAGSKTGSDSQSRTDRAEASLPGDCLQESRLVLEATQGNKPFLTQEEVQRFIRGCSRLNCEVVFEMLNRSLDEDNPNVRLRSLSAIASLMTSDLLSHDHMLAVVRVSLQKLSAGPAGPVADKAKKILLQFEALSRGSPKSRTPAPPPLSSSSHSTLDLLNDAIPHPSAAGDLLTPAAISASPIPSLDSVDPPCSRPSVISSVQEEDQVNMDSVPPSVSGEDHSSPQSPADDPPVIRRSLFDGMELLSPVRSAANTDQQTAGGATNTGQLTAGGAANTGQPTAGGTTNTGQPTAGGATNTGQPTAGGTTNTGQPTEEGTNNSASQHRTAKPAVASAFSFLNT